MTAENVAKGLENADNVDDYVSGYFSTLVREQLLGGAESTYIVPPLAADKYLKTNLEVCIRFTAINSVNDAAFVFDKQSHPQSLQSHKT